MFSGEDIRLLRQIRRITRKEVYLKLKISQQRYSILENKQRVSEKSADRILKILRFSKEDAEEILKLLPPTSLTINTRQ